jgi:hypothetical protein
LSVVNKPWKLHVVAASSKWDDSIVSMVTVEPSATVLDLKAKCSVSSSCGGRLIFDRHCLDDESRTLESYAGMQDQSKLVYVEWSSHNMSVSDLANITRQANLTRLTRLVHAQKHTLPTREDETSQMPDFENTITPTCGSDCEHAAFQLQVTISEATQAKLKLSMGELSLRVLPCRTVAQLKLQIFDTIGLEFRDCRLFLPSDMDLDPVDPARTSSSVASVASRTKELADSVELADYSIGPHVTLIVTMFSSRGDDPETEPHVPGNARPRDLPFFNVKMVRPWDVSRISWDVAFDSYINDAPAAYSPLLAPLEKGLACLLGKLYAPLQEVLNRCAPVHEPDNLQVIVQVADHFVGKGQDERSAWDLFGMPHEDIIATAVYCGAQTPGLQSELCLRPYYPQDHEGVPNDTYESDSDDDDFPHTIIPDFDFDDCNNPDDIGDCVEATIALQDVLESLRKEGAFQTSPGSFIVIPNNLQHQVRTFNAADTIGRRRVITFHIVNPSNRLCSSKHVPYHEDDTTHHKRQLMTARAHSRDKCEGPLRDARIESLKKLINEIESHRDELEDRSATSYSDSDHSGNSDSNSEYNY